MVVEGTCAQLPLTRFLRFAVRLHGGNYTRPALMLSDMYKMTGQDDPMEELVAYELIMMLKYTYDGKTLQGHTPKDVLEDVNLDDDEADFPPDPELAFVGINNPGTGEEEANSWPSLLEPKVIMTWEDSRRRAETG